MNNDLLDKAEDAAAGYLETIEDIDYDTLLEIFVSGAIWALTVYKEEK